MSRSQYKQMIGRAGRAGIDSSGESVLVIGKKDKCKLQKLIRGATGTCTSSLMYEKGKGLRELLLSLLGLKVNLSVSFFLFLFISIVLNFKMLFPQSLHGRSLNKLKTSTTK